MRTTVVYCVASAPSVIEGPMHSAPGCARMWNLLADSFAIGMLLLGLSGLWMWARGRTPRQLVASVLGLSVAVLAAVLGPALLA